MAQKWFCKILVLVAVWSLSAVSAAHAQTTVRFTTVVGTIDVELFDMETDRGETKNLADKYPEVVTRLAKACIAWHKSMPPDNGPNLVRKPKKKK